MEAKLNKYDIPNDYLGDIIPDYKRYVGKAKCCPEDEWDESYGRKLAEYRAMKKRTDDVNREIENFIRGAVDNLNRLGTYGVMKEPKHPDDNREEEADE